MCSRRHIRLTAPLPQRLNGAMRIRHLLGASALLLASLFASPARAMESAYFSTSDGVRLHVITAGSADGPVMVLVPGWTMPAWIFQAQIQEFSRRYRVVALDPRGQGDSEVAASGYGPARRGQDIADLIARMGPRPVLLVAWSLGVLDSLGLRAAVRGSQAGRPGPGGQLGRRGPARHCQAGCPPSAARASNARCRCGTSSAACSAARPARSIWPS